MTCNDIACNCTGYFFAIFEIEDSGKFGFHIGFKVNDAIKLLCTKGSYDFPDEAEIAASAFISGMIFGNEVDNEQFSKNNQFN